MHFVVIIMVIISQALKKEQDGGQTMCENNKGIHEKKKVEKHYIRRYGPRLNAIFSKWPRVKLIAHSGADTGGECRGCIPPPDLNRC